MAWLSRVNFISSDTLSFTDVNNLGNDIRAWGDNVNGGGYTLSNVAISASSGTMGLVIGGTGTTSTLRLRSTSGVGTTGADIIFQAGNNGATEVMRLQNGGNVGIGTASPSQKLDVVGNLSLSGQSTGSQYITIGSGRSSNGFSYIDLVGDTTYSSFGTRLIRGTGGANTGTSLQHRGTGEFQLYAYEAAPLVVYLNSAERMRIDSSGNVGIGTASPAAKLDIRGAGAGIIVAPDNNSAGGISLFGTNAQTYGSPPIYFLSAANNGGYPTAGVGLGSLDFRNSAYGQGAYIYAYATQNHSSTASGGELRFGTTLNGSTSASERMRIDSSGNVKVGGTADRATTAGTNQVVIFNGTAPVGTLANGCSFYSTAGEMRVMDAAGNATLLSPHDSVTNEWIYDSSHTPSGKHLKINVERLLRFINDHFGLDCVHDLMEEA